MDLKKYVEIKTQSHLAKLIGVAPSFVHQWVNGVRPVPVQICVVIEQATNGEVTRKELRPKDWHLIWPELIGAEGVPPAERLSEEEGA